MSGSSADSPSDSSEDEGGVFLGPHDPLESLLLAKLSDETPAPNSPYSHGRHRRTLITRVKKRDSRDYMRRKTLLSSTTHGSSRDKNGSPKGKPKIWDVGFHERRDEEESEAESESSVSSSRIQLQPNPQRSERTLSKPNATVLHSDLTLDFSAFRLTDTPPTSVSSIEAIDKDRAYPNVKPRADEQEEDSGRMEDDSAAEDSEAGDSDKENTVLRIDPGIESDDKEDVGSMKESGVILGFGAMESNGFVSDMTSDAGELRKQF